MLKVLKIIKFIFAFFVISVFLLVILAQGKVHKKDELEYGLTFSGKQAWSLGLNARDVYKRLFDELGVKKIRLSAYWDEIEKTPGEFDFSELDWQIEEAGKRNVEIILAVGYRLPRWPECHLPSWAQEKIKKGDKASFEKDVLEYLEKIISRYKDKKSIIAWQIENEPFLPGFGECPPFNSKFLDQEISLARKLDRRPLVVTDSGELSFWIPAARRADIFGTSLYLNTYSANLKKYIHYPIAPAFFHFKRNITRIFSHPKKIIVIEMQAEPWGPVAYQNLSEAEMSRTMNLDKFKNILEFGRRSGFKEFYLWGAEWWYWEKEVKNNPAYWEEAKKLFKK